MNKPAQRITGPRNLQLASGFKDRLGPEQSWWGYYQKVAFEVMAKYNFSMVYPASIDYTAAYIRSYGKDAPIINENLLGVIDPREEHISLRPNMDFSYMRAYVLQHKQSMEQGMMPIENWYTVGSVWGEKFEPREKLQMYMSVLGNNHPVVDAECTVAAYRFLQGLGFEQVKVLVNSIGGEQSQQMFKQELANYYKERRKEVCKECQPYVGKSPMQVLVCERKECKELSMEAPQSVDWLTEEDKEHFVRVLEYLDELEVPYLLSPELLPVNDHYSKTIIALKIITDDGTEYQLAKGGRYDGLASELSTFEIPAMSMVIDLDKCLTATRTQKLEIPQWRQPQVFLAQLGDAAKKRALAMREDLHDAGIQSIEHFGQDSLKEQLDHATRLGVQFTCILGQKEILDGTILIRDMDGGIQEEVPQDKFIQEIKKRLAES